MKTLTCTALMTLMMLTGCEKEPAKPKAKAAAAEPEAQKPPASPQPEAQKPQPEAQKSQPPKAAKGETVTLLGHTASVPAGWTAEQPRSRMRIAQMRLPKVGSDSQDGELTVTSIGGSVDANIKRWQGQFEGEPTVQRSERKANGLTVHAVSIVGTYLLKRAPMAPGPGSPMPDYMMLGAIVTTDRGPLIFKAWGPKATMAAHSAAFTQFVDSLNSGG